MPGRANRRPIISCCADVELLAACAVESEATITTKACDCGFPHLNTYPDISLYHVEHAPLLHRNWIRFAFEMDSDAVG